MASTQKRVLALLLFISTIYFSIFIIPNNTGANDQMMISLFEPDEFAQYPIVTKMLTPREDLKKTIINFVAYRHYYYGSPFYFSSALAILPVKLAEGLNNTQLNMLLLRQFISVLPMLGALLLLTYIQTKFQSYKKSIALFVLLLSVSAVVENNMWWHVDSLAVFFTALTFFFLDKDDLHFGSDFYLAAASVGLATGTKVIGFFFILTIPTYLLLGILQKQMTWRMAILRGAAFVGIMFAAILVSNPFLLLRSESSHMLNLLTRQSAAMSEGWILAYDKGPISWLPIIQGLYGQLIFIALAFIALALGIWRGTNKTIHLLIATWAIPFGLYVLYTIAIKPSHFFLPILLPVFSSLVVLFEFPPFANVTLSEATLPGTARQGKCAPRMICLANHAGESLKARLTEVFQSLHSSKVMGSFIWGGLVLTIIACQFTIYINKDIEMFREVLAREENEGSLAFYSVLERDVLPRLPTDSQLVVFRDVRMYFPENPQWVVRSYWNSNYKVMERIKPDLIILWTQRILDYTQAGAQDNALDPESFQNTYNFYIDVDKDQLRGYRLVYRDANGLFFVSNEIYERYFK